MFNQAIPQFPDGTEGINHQSTDHQTKLIKMKWRCIPFSIALAHFVHNPVLGFANQLSSRARSSLEPKPLKSPAFSAICSAQFGTANSALTSLTSSLLKGTGQVPLSQSFGINAFLFTALSPKLFTMLTPTGFVHSCALGTFLWNALGYKGWSLCVLYLFLGQLVTKIRFTGKLLRPIEEVNPNQNDPTKGNKSEL